jgi:predicted ABC-type sugar transport system permease subunit
MFFAGGFSVGSILGLDYFADAVDAWLPTWLGGAAFLGGYGLSTIVGAVLGFWIGRRRNQKFNY